MTDFRDALSKALVANPDESIAKTVAIVDAYLLVMESGRLAEAYGVAKAIAASPGPALRRSRAALLLPELFPFTGVDPDRAAEDARSALQALVDASEPTIAGAATQAYLQLVTDDMPAEELRQMLAPGLAALEQRAEFDPDAANGLLKVGGAPVAKRWLAEIAAGHSHLVDLALLAQVIATAPSDDCVEPLATVIKGLLAARGDDEPVFTRLGEQSLPDVDTMRLGALVELLARIDRPRAEACLTDARPGLRKTLMGFLH